MRVLVVVNELEAGGAERLIVDQVTHTHAIEFHVCQLGGGVQLAPLLGLPAERVQHLREAGRLDLRVTWRLRRVATRTRPDLVHAHLPRAGFHAGLVARSLGLPFLYTEHNVWAGYPVLGRPLALSAAWLADRVVAVSEEVRDSTLRHTRIPVARITTIRNGVALSRLPRRADHRALTAVRLCSVGNLYPRKGHTYLIRALGLLRDRGVPATLDVIGEGPERTALARLMHELALEEVVALRGGVPDAATLLADYDAFVLPSVAEGLPVALLEAMGVGLPVVATRVGGISEVVTNGLNGMLVAASDVEALAAALQRIASDPELRARLGAAGHDTVRTRFSVEAMADGYRTCYADLANRVRRAARA